ncbi:molybdopterin cofactor-binding domain-containing protein [Teichococcus aestuarii]|uniref:molybdopterin cofactor-binding domain-containing protein n=1 Tax=Teichococcus aestuarii TaxID=568898 RepID=UPI003618C650
MLAVSRIARGRVAALDLPAARAHPGVVEVMVTANRPALALHPDDKSVPFSFKLDLLQDDRVRYAGQPIAVVIAATLEAATEAAALLAPRYEAGPVEVTLDAPGGYVPESVGVGDPGEMRHGDVEAGLRAAARRIEATYETPLQFHNAMEPHGVVAAWEGDALSLDMPTQGTALTRMRRPRCSASGRKTSTSAAPSSAAASGRSCCPGRRCWASWRRGSSGAR